MAPPDPASSHLSYLRPVLDYTNDPLFVTEKVPGEPPRHRICFVNDAFTRLTGYSLRDAAGVPATFLYAPSNATDLVDQVGAAFARGERATFVLLSSRKDGSRFRAELSIGPLADDGRCDHMIAVQRVHMEQPAEEGSPGAVEDRFQALADILTEAVLIYRDGQPLFANRAYVALFGYATMAEALREISPLMNLPLGESGHCEVLRTDGAPLRLKLRSHAVDWRGGPAVMLSIERDRGRAAAVQRPASPAPGTAAPPASDESRLLRELMDSMPVILAHKTRDLRYSYVNRTYADWVGLPRDQIVGRHVGAVRNEAHFQLMRARRAEVLSGKVVRYETKCEFPGRGMCDLITTLIPQRNADGAVEGYFSLAQDVTDLKDVERALLQREQQLRLVMDSVPALISYRDRNLRYQYVNRQYHECYGVRREDMIGRHMTEFVGLERFRRLKPHIDRVLAGEQVRHTQIVDFPGAGKRKMPISFIPHENENGHVVGFFSLSHEVPLAGEKPAAGERRAEHAATDAVSGPIAGGE